MASLFSYAGVSMREEEASWCDTNRVRFLKQRGWGYVVPLIVDGRQEVNRADLDRIRRDTRASGMALLGWVTPRPVAPAGQTAVPIEETLQMTADAVARYGLDGIRYQCEAEFEYTASYAGGTPAERFNSMAVLGEAHRRLMGTLPGAVYARTALGICDAWWAKAWQYQFRCFIENYGPAEGPTHPSWSSFTAPNSALPQLVGGWWYRVKLGAKFYLGHMDDDARGILVDGQGHFRVGSPAGPRYISQFGNPKWGGIVGFFPTAWIKPTEPSYAGAAGVKPSGTTLAAEIRTFQTLLRKFGGASKGYSVYVGPEMTDDQFAHISPNVLTGAALLP